MEESTFKKFEEILEPLGDRSAQFFLAASLYHARKVSFRRAAELADLSFEDFKARLKEHFGAGYFLLEHVVQADIESADRISSEL